MTKSNLFKTILFAAIALLLAGGAQALNLGADGGNVAWNVDTANDGVQLSVSGPDGFVWEQTYDAGEAPSFSIFDKNGYVFPEGEYNWELTIIPAIDDATRKAMHAARESGDQVALAQLEKSLGQRTHSGTFRVEGGSVMLPTEMPEMPERLEKAQATDQALEKDFVINDDLIVTLSACIGNDCVNGEVFSFDTIRLKENNLRIKFEDTSVGSFPTSDWEIEANSSANGGASYFRVDDVTAGTSPFTIEANAPSHTLYVDSTKRIGIGTSTPVVELHVKHGDSPTLRLEQDGSSGFQPQTWDIAGNEANFFVRDATNGSTLPFRIRPGAPTSSIDIAANGDVTMSGGNVGIGTTSPALNLHVEGDGLTFARIGNKTANARVDLGINGSGEFAVVAFNDGTGQYVNANWQANQWSFKSGPSGNIQGLFQDANGNVGIGDTTPAGTLDVNGSIFQRGTSLHADYVFTPEYDLESIEEHADFMWTNRHLPAVTARQVDEEGREVIELGAHRRGMLEELEKAHIYIEQLHQRIEALEAKIEPGSAED